MQRKVRVRFAPSPTGGLHLGGVRTVLFNYLFAKQHKGDFILRIEDTDQSRYVPGAEEYIYDTLLWCGLEPDESPRHGGNYGPYRQSERKDLYSKYAVELVEKGLAYYAFDTPEELDKMRNELRTDENPSPQYDHFVRMSMRNSLTLTKEETENLLKQNIPYVIRIKITPEETVSLQDIIRGEVNFETSVLDDKVLLKADGMPTYHLAVVVDDYLMEISHAFRGEEWLPSAPIHIILWKELFGLEKMPEWAHLPLILGPHGKLSKRDGSKYGFPVFAMNWQDPQSGELTEGFREKGFLPEAFINLLAMLGWNDGTEQEIFSKEELVEKFKLNKVHKGGARFDYEKAKWFNHEWIKRIRVFELNDIIKKDLNSRGIMINDEAYLSKVINLVKDRCHLVTEFWEQSHFFFRPPQSIDTAGIKSWNISKSEFFEEFIKALNRISNWTAASLEEMFKNLANQNNIKPGELQLPLRLMLVGGKYGPPVFEIAAVLGKDETVARMETALPEFFKIV